MSDAEWEDAYQAAWRRLLQPRGHADMLRRAAAHSRYAVEIVVKLRRYWGVYREVKAIYRDVMRAPDRQSYSDVP